METKTCSECGAPLEGVSECREYLNEMIRWDFEDFLGVGKVHHLTVLSYNLQHPSLYSSKGLEEAKQSLIEFVKQPTSYSHHDLYNRQIFGSNSRKWKIIGTLQDHGEYKQKPQWQMRASDVVKDGLGNYVENVIKWSNSVLRALIESGNLKDANRVVYKGTLIENSLSNKDILKKIRINKTWHESDWTLHAISVDEDQIAQLSGSLGNGPWYIHIWQKGKDDVKVIYKDKIFDIKFSDKATWADAVEYGKSLGIPEKQLDFPID